MPGERAPEHERREQILSAAFRLAAAEGLSAVTSRRVAGEAGLSVGSILFHFGTMDDLVVALLEWWLDRLSAPLSHYRPVAGERSCETMVELLNTEIRRTARERVSAELFFDFWALGTRRPEIRARIRAELGRYRVAFERIVAAYLPDVADDDLAEGVAALAVALIQGYAVQAAIDPEAVPEERYLELAASLLRRAVGQSIP
jgi:AcrR family transcriptional regulator